MKTKTFCLILVVCFLSSGACFAQVFNGNWKLNPGKSKFHGGGERNYWVRYQGTPFTWTKVTVYGRDAKGQDTHNEWTGYFDGKAYPVRGAADEDARAYTMVDDHTLNFMSIKDGKAVLRGKIVIAADDNSRTVTTWHSVWHRHHRMTIKNVAYYDRA